MFAYFRLGHQYSVLVMKGIQLDSASRGKKWLIPELMSHSPYAETIRLEREHLKERAKLAIERFNRLEKVAVRQASIAEIQKEVNRYW